MAHAPPARQSEIVNSVTVTEELVRRPQAAESAPQSAFHFSSEADLEIRHHELVFGFTEPQSYVGVGRPGAPSERGFSSFNGLIPPSSSSQEDFMDSLYLIGYNRHTYNPLDKLEPKNGMSVTRFGVVYTDYDMVKQDAYPGDTLVWTVPPLPSLAEPGELTNYGLSSERGKTKLIGSVEPYDSSHVADYMANMFETMMSRESGVYDLGLEALEAGYGKHVSSAAQGALALRHFALFAPLQAVSALQERGIVKIQTPSEHQREQLLTLFEGDQIDATQLKRELGNIQKTDVEQGINTEYRMYTVSNDGATVELQDMLAPTATQSQEFFHSDAHLLDRPAAQIRQTREDQQGRLLFLAQLLGGVGAKASPAVRDGVIYSIFNEWTASAENGTEMFLPRFDEYMQRHDSPLARAYKRRAMTAPAKFAEAFNQAKRGYERRIVGKSLSFARGGKQNAKINFLLNR
jgi:hypothetical protein